MCRTSSPSFFLGLAVGEHVRFSPSTVRPFAASRPRVRGHGRFSPAAYVHIFTSRSFSETHEVPSVCLWREGLPIQGPALRPGLGAENVHKMHGCCTGPFEAPGHSCAELSGRLAHSGSLQGASKSSQRYRSLPHPFSWPQDERQEECAPPISANRVSGGSFGFYSDAGPFGSCPDIQFYSMSGPLHLGHHVSVGTCRRLLRPHGSGLPCVAPRVDSHEAVPLVDERAEVTPHYTSHSPYQGVAQLRMGAIHRRHMITTDASMMGWGAAFEGRPASGEWTGEFLSWHINCLELWAVFLALMYFLPVLGGHHIIVRTDNMAVVSHINRQGGSRSRTLDRLAHRLLLWSQHKFLSLRAVHVPGILNLADDFLSRQKLRPGEWMLNRQTVSQIWYLFGKAEVDLFASQESSQCPLWFSLSFPMTLGIDAFAHPWPNVSLYVFPPIKLIPAVLFRVKVSSARLLLIAPFWPSQTWFSEITPLLYRPPWEIPIRQDLLSQLQGRIWHPQKELWKLWVWSIQAQGP